MSIQTSCCATTVIEASRSKEGARGRGAGQAVCQKKHGKNQTRWASHRGVSSRGSGGRSWVAEVQQLDATTPVVATLLPRPLLRVQQELVFHLEEEPTKLVDSDEVPGLHREVEVSASSTTRPTARGFRSTSDDATSLSKVIWPSRVEGLGALASIASTRAGRTPF